jgi:hypothetical protein
MPDMKQANPDEMSSHLQAAAAQAQRLIKRMCMAQRAFDSRAGQRLRPGLNWQQLEAQQARLGCRLPADVLACYAAHDGYCSLPGWLWLKLEVGVLRSRLLTLFAYHLRTNEPGWLAPGGADGEAHAHREVRADAWNAGWLIVADSELALH